MNPHLAVPPVTVGPPVAGARRVAVVVHGREQDPEYMLEHLVEPERVVLAGFSQGACLVAELLARAPRRFAGAAILTGAFIGPQPEPAGLDGVPVFMESSRYDEWVALDHVEATAKAFEAAGARVELQVSDDREHRIRDAAVAGVRALL